MPRLQILQHKSYHPYLEKNKDRVRKDEERAAILEAEEEKDLLDIDQAARLNLLRSQSTSQPSSGSSSSLMPSAPSKLLTQHRKTQTHGDREQSIRLDARKEKAKLEFDWPDVEKKKREKAALKEAAERERKGKGKEDQVYLGEEGRHINFWAGLEGETSLLPATRPKPKQTPDQIQSDDPTTMYLHRPERETKPWYTDPSLRRYEERDTGEDAERRRLKRERKEASSKSRADPFNLIQSVLSQSQKPTIPPPSRSQSHFHPRPSNPNPSTTTPDPTTLRLSRESTERTRALALIAETQRKTQSSSVSSAIGSAGEEKSYGNLYNAREVGEARRRREAVRSWVGGAGEGRRGGRYWEV